MIDKTATKGYAYIKIEIYHNNKNIDFDSIREEYEEDLKNLSENEEKFIKEIDDKN